MSMRNIAGRKGSLAKPEPVREAQQTKPNDRLIETAAEQLAVLLWKTWLYKMTMRDSTKRKKDFPKQPPTAF